jgi:hypothetical protein
MFNPAMSQAIVADRQAALRSAAVRERLAASAPTPHASAVRSHKAHRGLLRRFSWRVNITG